jgi:hypothetical protein
MVEKGKGKRRKRCRWENGEKGLGGVGVRECVLKVRSDRQREPKPGRGGRSIVVRLSTPPRRETKDEARALIGSLRRASY